MCIGQGDDNPPDDSILTAGRATYDDVPAVQLNQIPAAGATAVRTALINDYFQ